MFVPERRAVLRSDAAHSGYRKNQDQKVEAGDLREGQDVRCAHEKTRAKIGTDDSPHVCPFFARDRDPDHEHCQDDAMQEKALITSHSYKLLTSALVRLPEMSLFWAYVKGHHELVSGSALEPIEDAG